MSAAPPNRLNRSLAHVALALLVASAALAIVPTAAATSHCVGFAISPTATEAAPLQQDTFRTIRVTAPTANSVTQLRFSSSLEVLASSDERGITFDQAYSSAPGWTATTYTPAQTGSGQYQLEFTDDTTLAPNPITITPGGTQAFRVGFDVYNKPEPVVGGKYFDIGVAASVTGGGTPCSATLRVYIDDTPPAILNPYGAVTRDTNTNGKLDQMIVTFDQIVNEADFKITDLQIAGYTITAATFASPPIAPGASYNALAPVGTAVCPDDSPSLTKQPNIGCSQVFLTLAESFSYDTGNQPQVTYNPATGTLRDMGDTEMLLTGNAAVQEEDQARPVLVGALAYFLTPNSSDPAGSATSGPFNRVRVFFSENVETADSTNAAPPKLDNDDLFYLNGGCSGGSLQTINSIGHPVDGNLEDKAVIYPNTALINCDVDQASGDSVCLTDPAAPGPIRVRDEEGNLAFSSCIRVQTPYATLAEVNIDSFRLTLKFSVPVSDISGDNQPVKAQNFDVVTTTNGGPEGVKSVTHVACTDLVVIELDKRVLPTDVDLTPSKIRITGGQVKGCGSVAGSSAVTVPQMDVPMHDFTPPAITSAKTQDVDGNGAIDGLFVEFNEPINDDSFCDFDDSCDGLMTVVSPNIGLPVFGPYTFDTDVNVNDRFGVIKWPANTPGASPSTGDVPDLLADPRLFLDFATVPNGMLAIDTGAIKESDGAAPIIVSATTVDSGVYPVPTPPAAPCLIGEGTCVDNGNGFLDAYRVVFSEPVLDASFHASEWRVNGPTKMSVGYTTGDRKGDRANDAVVHVKFTEPQQVDADGDPIPDTDARYELTYLFPGGAGTGLRDLGGNALGTIDSADVVEVDGARPVIVRVEGLPDRNTLTLTFSEPVDDGVSGPLTRADFVYSNIVPAGSTSQVSGLSGSIDVVHQPGQKTAVVTLNSKLHEDDLANDRIGSQASADLSGVFSCCVRETAPSKSVSERLYVRNFLRILNETADVVPPAQIVDLAASLPTSNSVHLTWTAPGEDGTIGGRVSGYEVCVSEENPFPPLGGTVSCSAAENPDGLTIQDAGLDPANPPTDLLTLLANPGEREEVIVTGLGPGTLYSFAVKSFDGEDVPNVSLASNVVTRETDEDDTPPVGSLVVSTLSHRPNVKTLDREAQFTWNAVTDPESTVVYHYQLNELAEYQVTETDPSTTATSLEITIPAMGTWYLHVRAFSSLPQAATARSTAIEIGHPDIDVDEIITLNLELVQKAYANRTKDGNVIEWDLPADLPGELVGVKVWRLDEGAYAAIATVSGDAVSLAHGSYLDANGTTDSRYLLTLVYAGPQEDDQVNTGTYPQQIVTKAKGGGDGSLWIWILAGVALALIIAGIAVVMVMRSRRAAAETAPLAQQGWAEGGPAGTDAESGLPTHDVKCPSCGTDFQAVGNLPLGISCPNCGVGGQLK